MTEPRKDDLFVVEVPRPGEVLTKASIAAANRERIAARQEPRLMTPLQVKKARHQLKRINKALDDLGWSHIEGRMQYMWAYYQETGLAWQKLDPAADKAERSKLRNDGYLIRAKMEQYRLRHANAFALAQKKERIERRLIDHAAAARREARAVDLRQQQEDEAHEWHDKIIETWTRMGYCHRRTVKGRTKTDRVRFEKIIVTEDEVQIKIAVSSRGLLGWKDLLPYGVKTYDLVDEKSVQEITTAVQRQVTAHQSELNGTWVVIHRPSAANSVIHYVTLEAILKKRDPKVHTRYPIALGVSAGRQIEYMYLDTQPHLLIGGETGGGKSNFFNGLLGQLITFYRPDELQLVLIDLKEQVEFKPYAHIPHLMMPVVATLEGMIETLARLEALRRERMELISNAGAHDISEYNEQASDSNRMPRVVCFIDEYAEVLADNVMAARVERYMGQLTAKARAAGINIIVATQNPYAHIISGHLKGNMGARIAFAMSSINNSRTILDGGDAAKLRRIPGRAIVKSGADMKEVQTPHCRREDLERALEKALSYERTDDLLPVVNKETALPAFFGVDQVVSIAMDRLGGSLSYRRIHESAADDYPHVSRNMVKELVEAVVANGFVDYDGHRYGLVKRGAGWMIDKSEHTATEPDEETDCQVEAVIS